MQKSNTWSDWISAPPRHVHFFIFQRDLRAISLTNVPWLSKSSPLVLLQLAPGLPVLCHESYALSRLCSKLSISDKKWRWNRCVWDWSLTFVGSEACFFLGNYETELFKNNLLEAPVHLKENGRFGYLNTFPWGIIQLLWVGILKENLYCPKVFSRYSHKCEPPEQCWRPGNCIFPALF